MVKKVLILDSNKKTILALKNIIQDINQNILIYTPEGYDEACKIALDTQIDVFILDVIITNVVPGDTSGLKFAECIRAIKCYYFTPIIFISGVIDHKFYAFNKLHSFAYLEKPFSKKDAEMIFRQALLYQAPKVEDKVLYFRRSGILYAIKPKAIVYVNVIQHVLNIHMTDEMLSFPYYTIKQFLKEADDEMFIQCSRSTVINKRFLRYIDIPNRYLQLRTLDASIEIGATFLKKLTEELLNDTDQL